MNPVVSIALRLVRHLDGALQALRRVFLPPELVVFEDATAPWLTSALGTICELELAEEVPSRGYIELEEVGRRTRLNEAGLARLFKVVVSHGYFEFGPKGRSVRHTRLSRALVKGRGGRFCLLQASSWYRECFSSDRVVKSMRACRTPFESTLEQPFFDFVTSDPEKARLFSQAMAEITRFCAPYIATALSLKKGDRVLDIGGGNGEFCRLLRVYFDRVSFAVVDLDVPANAVDDEVRLLAGDFFEPLPRGFDHFLMKNVLHDWDDTTAKKILQNCRAAADPGKRLTLIELVLPSAVRGATVSARDFCVDWNVYCTLGGQERTLDDYVGLLNSTGWRFEKCSLTPTPLCLLEAVAV